MLSVRLSEIPVRFNHRGRVEGADETGFLKKGLTLASRLIAAQRRSDLPSSRPASIISQLGRLVSS